MALPILHYPDPRLRQVSRPVEHITDEHRTLAENMAKTMYLADGVGLAAPQVGHFERIVVIDVTGPEVREGLMVLVNPRITPVEDAGRCESEEGCLSVPEFRSKVKRYARVRVEATDLSGQPIEFEAEGLLAVCVQHELDHLDGKLFIDHISRLKRSLFEGRLRKKQREEA